LHALSEPERACQQDGAQRFLRDALRRASRRRAPGTLLSGRAREDQIEIALAREIDDCLRRMSAARGDLEFDARRARLFDHRLMQLSNGRGNPKVVRCAFDDRECGERCSA